MYADYNNRTLTYGSFTIYLNFLMLTFFIILQYGKIKNSIFLSELRNPVLPMDGTMQELRRMEHPGGGSR